MNRIKNKNQLSMYESQNRREVLLSVVISCKALVEILKKNLEALSRQNLSRKTWDPVFIFRKEQQDLDCISLIKSYFPSSKILFLPKGKPIYEMRNLGLQTLSYPYIYFIDEDVILENPEHLNQLLALHKSFPELTVIGGSYLDHSDCTFWGRSYNWLARLWTKNQTNFVPAGNLSIKTNQSFKARFYSPNKFGFGGEEIYFLQSLKSEGYKSLWKKELDTQHLAQHNLKNFIKRAWFHGASLAFEKKRQKSSYSLFFKERASFLIKITALFYLLLVRFSSFFYKVS